MINVEAKNLLINAISLKTQNHAQDSLHIAILCEEQPPVCLQHRGEPIQTDQISAANQAQQKAAEKSRV
jgi:hypothetical protein